MADNNDEEVAAPTPEQSGQKEAAAGGGATIAGVHLSSAQFPLAIVLVASIVLLIAVTSHYGVSFDNFSPDGLCA